MAVFIEKLRGSWFELLTSPSKESMVDKPRTTLDGDKAWYLPGNLRN